MFVPYNTVLGRLAMTPLVSFHPGEQDCLIPTGELFVDGTKWDLGSFHPGEGLSDSYGGPVGCGNLYILYD